MRKYGIILIVCAFALYVAWRFFTTEAAATRARSATGIVAVETTRIARADLSDRAVFTGSIRAAERYDVAPKISGIIRQINFNVGDIVRKGDALVTLDDDEHILAVDQSEARLQVALAAASDAAAQLAIASREFDRIEKLLSERVISTQEFDRTDAAMKAAEAKRDTALAEVNLAKAELQSAKVRLGYTRIHADWTEGADERVIGQRYMDAGAHAAANTPILSVLDIAAVRAVIPVSEKEYPKIVPGGAVAVTTDAFPGRAFEGRVSRIPQELGVLTREAEVEVAVDNPDRALKPGMFIRAEIEFRRSDNAVAVPVAAIVRRDDGERGVYAVNGTRDAVAFLPVAQGILDGGLVELVNGDNLLDREVVVMGQHLLKDGIGVRVADSGASAAAGAPGGDA